MKHEQKSDNFKSGLDHRREARWLFVTDKGSVARDDPVAAWVAAEKIVNGVGDCTWREKTNATGT